MIGTKNVDYTGRPQGDIAELWYAEYQVIDAIRRSGSGITGTWDKIPEDVHSQEFAKWLTHHLRAAMEKGVQLGRGIHD